MPSLCYSHTPRWHGLTWEYTALPEEGQKVFPMCIFFSDFWDLNSSVMLSSDLCSRNLTCLDRTGHALWPLTLSVVCCDHCGVVLTALQTSDDTAGGRCVTAEHCATCSPGEDGVV